MARIVRRLAELLSFGVAFASLSFAATAPKVQVQPQTRIVNKIDNAKLTTLAHTAPALASVAVDKGHLAASTQLNHMMLVLKGTDEQDYALRSLLDEQQDKSSPNYHKWMTPETFGAAFGVSSTDLAKVSAWLQDSGFSVEQISKGGRTIQFSGTAGQVETAFHTELHNITVNGEAHFVNTTDLSVPEALSPVITGVSKLNNFSVKSSAVNAHPMVRGTDGQFYPVVPGTNQPDYTSLSSGNHYIAPADVATIYNAKPLLSSGINGTGQTIGVIGQSTINISNVETFRSMFQLPNNDPQIINVGPPPAIIADDIESDLDVEWAGALATSAKVKFYTAGVGGFYDVGIDVSALQAVDSNVADIISLSYGGCELSNGSAGTAYWIGLWQQAAAQGQTVFVSTGDSSATTCASSSAALATGSTAGSYAVNALGSTAYNVAVGGTGFNEGATALVTGPTIYWGAGGVAPYGTALSYIPETVYSEGVFDTVIPGTGIAGGGGGVSIFTGRPAWQVGPGITNADPAGPTFTAAGAIPATQLHRLVPDVSLIAAGGHDGTIFCSEGVCKLDSNGNVAGIGVVGGTSVATPVMAGVQALINQKNGGRQGNANYFYYPLAAAQTTANCASTLPPVATCNFNDTVSGNNYSPKTNNAKYNISTGVISGTFGTDYIGFAALPGFDEATGLGTPNITNLANNWKNVTFNATKTTLTLSPTTTAHGTAIAATVAVAPLSGSGTATGNVSFTAVGQPMAGFDGNVYTLSAGSVSASLTALPGGTYNVVAHYAGDSVYGASDSAPVKVTIAKEDVGMFLTPYQATSGGSLTVVSTWPYGTSIYLDTDVQGKSATAVNGNNVLNTGVPTGTISYTINNGTTALAPATANLDVYGTTYLEFGPSFSGYLLNANYPSVVPATYSVTASYPGDNSFNPSSATTSFIVVKASVNPTLRAATTAISSGGQAIFNVTIAASGAGVLPTGTVTLTDNTTSTVLASNVALVNGAVAISTNSITSAGTHTIVAAYNGDTNYNATNSSTVSITVGGSSSTTALAMTIANLPATTAPVLTAVTLTATPPSTATGTVYFYDGAASIGSANISTTTHLATLTVSTLTAGQHVLYAVYGGNGTLAASTSSGVSFLSTQNTPTISLTSQQANNATSPISMNAVLTLNPANTAAANPAPSAAVQFKDGATVMGTASLAYTPNYHTYSAAFTTATGLKPGPHVLTAFFPGDTNYTATISGVQNVSIGLTTTTLTTSSTNVGVGPVFTLSATVAAVVANTAPITGTVTFKDGAIVMGTATVTNGVATLTTAAVSTVGTHTLTATYSGDANYYTSTSTNTVTISAVTPGFSLTANPTSLTIARGSSGTVKITATAFGNYNGAAQFVCLGLPANAFCSVSPAPGVAFAGANETEQVNLTITALAPAARATSASSFLWLPALAFGALLTIRRKQLTVRGRQLLMLVVLACGMMAVSGCGSGGFAGTPTGSSNVVVQANAIGNGPGSANITPTVTIALTVQ